jgi:hypothetical protein
VHRYARDFSPAWVAYDQAETIFRELGDWPWLGLVYQEQAICLFQASQLGVLLGSFINAEEMYQRACERILPALDLCRDLSVRAYPSALNRAGRIFGSRDYDQGIAYLQEGIKQARKIDDGWMWLANMVECAELNYHAWLRGEDEQYRRDIASLEDGVAQAEAAYHFPDLSGRWRLLLAHLAVRDALKEGNAARQASLFAQAVEGFKRGFGLLAQGYFGSHGAWAIPKEFQAFAETLARLDRETRKEWCEELDEVWSDPQKGYIRSTRESASLKARLTEIYAKLVPAA